MAGPAVGEYQFGFPVEAVIVGPIVVTPTPNRAAVTFRTVTVVTSGTFVQGPTVTVPDGFALFTKVRTTNTGNPTVFVANSGVNTGISASRMELKKTESISLKIDNMDLLFFDSNANGVVIELVAEQ